MKFNAAAMASAFVFALQTAGQAQEIDETALNELPEVQVVFLGEVHDNPHHHTNQAKALKALAPKAVVFEMLTSEVAATVTPAMLLDSQELARVLDWDNSGWPDFEMYFPVFEASAGAQIYGAQVPRAAAREAVMSGDAVTAFGEGAERFGFMQDLPETEQTTREAEQMAAHCDALPEAMLPGMVLAQRLRDASLARAVMEGLEATGGPVAVITGNGHARTDWGAPALLPEGVTTLSLGQFEAASEEAAPFDLWLVTAPVEREDPCAAFK